MSVGSNYDWSYLAATPYEVLGVPFSASEAQIRSAWRRLTQFAHPDRGGTSALFVLTQEAYELLIDPVRRSDFDRGTYPANVDFGSTDTGTEGMGKDNPRQESTTKSRERQRVGKSDVEPTGAVTSGGFSLAWLLVLAANVVVAAHYPAIVAANRTGVMDPTQGPFMLVKPWSMSIAALTFLRGDLWIRYASMLFIVAATLLWLSKSSDRAPSWLRHHRDALRRTLFFFGVACSLPLLITAILWGFSIAVTLAIIALVIVLVVGFLAIA